MSLVNGKSRDLRYLWTSAVPSSSLKTAGLEGTRTSGHRPLAPVPCSPTLPRSSLLLLRTRPPSPNDPSASSPLLLSRVRWESERGGSHLPVIKYSEFSASSYLGNGELILCAYTPLLQFQFWESKLSVQGGLKSRVLPDKPKGEE